jgi:hypothetical protein
MVIPVTSGDVPSSYLVLPVFTPQVVDALLEKYGRAPEGWDTNERMEARRSSLIKFYTENDPNKFYTKEDMESTVRMLLTNYKFRDLAISLEKKYNKVPAGWEKQLDTNIMGSLSSMAGMKFGWGS